MPPPYYQLLFHHYSSNYSGLLLDQFFIKNRHLLRCLKIITI
nr:MAG TPA: hypothetical protein [Caudoviricetes sp.]